jgi:poly(hydroxyalkanoate) depolymerase family esterase
MNLDFQKLMQEATRLTRSGRLRDATAAIQRALGGATAPQQASAPATPARSDAPEHNATVVLDVEARVIDDTTDTPPDTPFVEPRRQDTSVGEAEQWTDGRFTHLGRTLAYKLYVPPRAAGIAPTPRPLVLMLHGCAQDPADFAAGTQMNTLARDRGVLVLYPAQTQPANPQKCWNWFKTQHQQRGRGEPAVLAALTQSVMADHQVDPSRVYVAGLSAGGAMADILGRTYPDVFGAVGVHSGLAAGAATDVMSALSAMHNGAAGTPRKGGGPKTPVIVFHGDADSTVNARNGTAVVDAARSGAGSAATQVVEGVSAGGQRFTRSVYPDVEHWQLHGAGHAWSGGSSQGSFADPRGADASSEMLRFFLAHPRVQG